MLFPQPLPWLELSYLLGLPGLTQKLKDAVTCSPCTELRHIIWHVPVSYSSETSCCLRLHHVFPGYPTPTSNKHWTCLILTETKVRRTESPLELPAAAPKIRTQSLLWVSDGPHLWQWSHKISSWFSNTVESGMMAQVCDLSYLDAEAIWSQVQSQPRQLRRPCHKMKNKKAGDVAPWVQIPTPKKIQWS